MEMDLSDQAVRIIIKLSYSSLLSSNVENKYGFYKIHFINVSLAI